MKKNLLIIVLIILALCVGVYFYLTKSSKTVTPASTAEKAASSLSTGVEKTNPFNVNVNPYQGYKNPFK